MIVTSEGLLPQSAAEMRSAPDVRAVAERIKKLPGGNTTKYGLIVSTVNGWTEAGGLVLTRRKAKIDTMPSRSWRDPYVYPVDGGLVFPELPIFKLLEPASAFREDPKSTVRRLIAKADGEIKQILDIRLLSAFFWASAYIAITDHEG